MPTQKNITYWARHLLLTLRSLKLLYFVPLLFLYLLIPLIACLDFLRDGADELMRANIITYHQFFIPFFSVWWMLLSFRKYVEEDGNELYYLYAGKSKLTECLLMSAFFLMHALLPYLVYTALFPVLWLDFLRLSMQCVLFAGLGYFLLFLTKSLALTLLPLLLYNLLCVAVEDGQNTLFLIFMSRCDPSPELLLRHDLPMFLCGCLLLWLGWLLNRKTIRYM